MTQADWDSMIEGFLPDRKERFYGLDPVSLGPPFLKLIS
jgi:hypothetical protein